MGDIAFNIIKDVDLNKVVNLDIDKDIDVNVNIDDLLATAEADAEAFGEFALAEVDAYTYVNGGERIPGPPVEEPGTASANGNTRDIILGPDEIGFEPNPDPTLPPILVPGADGAADILTIDFTSGGNIVAGLPDVDDINGSGALLDLEAPPPPFGPNPNELPDLLYPDNSDLFNITPNDLQLQQIGPAFEPDPISGVIEAEYESTQDWFVDYGTRTLDLDGVGGASNGNLQLRIPAGSTFFVEFLPTGAVEVEFDSFIMGNEGEWLFPDTIGTYEVTSFTFTADTLELGVSSNWSYNAAGVFLQEGPDIQGDGEAFAYAESTSALDLEATISVFSTQVGDIDGEPLTFEATGVGSFEIVSGNYAFIPPLAAEIPFIEIWALPKIAALDWAIKHFFTIADPDIAENSEINLESETEFATGHFMTSEHDYLLSNNVVIDNSTFSVFSPDQPLPLDIDNVNLIETTHTPSENPDEILIDTIFSSLEGDIIATSTGILTGASILDPFTTVSQLEIFPVGDGQTGTFTATTLEGLG